MYMLCSSISHATLINLAFNHAWTCVNLLTLAPTMPCISLVVVTTDDISTSVCLSISYHSLTPSCLSCCSHHPTSCTPLSESHCRPSSAPCWPTTPNCKSTFMRWESDHLDLPALCISIKSPFTLYFPELFTHITFHHFHLSPLDHHIPHITFHTPPHHMTIFPLHCTPHHTPISSLTPLPHPLTLYTTTEHSRRASSSLSAVELALRAQSHDSGGVCPPRPPGVAGCHSLWVHSHPALPPLHPLSPGHLQLSLWHVPGQLLRGTLQGRPDFCLHWRWSQGILYWVYLSTKSRYNYLITFVYWYWSQDIAFFVYTDAGVNVY